MLTRIRTAREDGEGGFTLIELLVVIIIIGILSAIAIPTYLNQQQKAKEASVKADLQALATNVQSLIVDTPDTITLAQTKAGDPVTLTPKTGTVNGTSITMQMSPGNAAEPADVKYVKATGAYCVQVTNDDENVPIWSVQNGALTKAACPTT